MKKLWENKANLVIMSPMLLCHTTMLNDTDITYISGDTEGAYRTYRPHIFL
jgi:hypothetical protein